MAIGETMVSACGNVGGILFDRTGDGDRCCSFTLMSNPATGGLVKSRWNVFGRLAELCDLKMHTGCYVTVFGEIMNRSQRSSGVTLTEFRVLKIVFSPMRGDGNGDEEVDEVFNRKTGKYEEVGPAGKGR